MLRSGFCILESGEEHEYKRNGCHYRCQCQVKLKFAWGGRMAEFDILSYKLCLTPKVNALRYLGVKVPEPAVACCSTT